MSEQADQIEKQSWHWRNTMRPVKFFMFDGRAAAPVFILIFHFRISTVLFTLCTLILFYILERHGLTVPAAWRAFRLYLTGDERPGWASIRRRRMIDYG